MRRSLIFLTVLSFVLSSIISVFFSNFGKHDFVAYWSASRLLLNGQNPYDPGLMNLTQQDNYPTLQQESGNAMNVWNPPWLLIFLIPWAVLPFNLAAFLWMWLTILLIGINVYFCLLLSSPKVTEWYFIIALVTCLLFAQTIDLIVIGQVSALVLSGLVVGIFLIKRGTLFLAGAILVLSTIKPHLSYLALLWIGWWVLRNRKASILVGAGFTIISSTLVTTLLFSDYLNAYFELLKNMEITNWYSSTIWSFLEATSGKPVFPWYGFLLLPLVFVLQPSKDLRDCFEKFCLILVASLALAPYGFSFDQVLLLPVIIQLLVWIKEKKIDKTAAQFSLGGLISLYLGSLILFNKGNIPYYYFFWVPWSFMIVYGIVYYKVRSRKYLLFR